MSILSNYDPDWELIRQDIPDRVLEDDTILIATDFEGGNGRNLRDFGDGEYSLVLEPDPGEHQFMGVGYYVCFGVVNKLPQPRTIRVRMRTRVHSWESWHDHHTMVIRQGGQWRLLDSQCLGTNREDLEVTLHLPAAGDDNALFVSNFHWWPGSERNAWMDGLNRARVRDIGTSFEGRAIRAVEIGREDAEAPCFVMSQTTQSSEGLGAHACRFIADYLLSDDEQAAQIREQFKICILPNTNPDGTARGQCVTDSIGRFTFFETDLAAKGDPDATEENKALWNYLVEQKPSLFWEWHSNNWCRRPGHVLIRYRSFLIEDRAARKVWDTIEERLLELPNTHHEEFCSWDEASYQPSIGFQAVTRLASIACMVKQHERFDLHESRTHAVACLKTATSTWLELNS